MTILNRKTLTTAALGLAMLGMTAAPAMAVTADQVSQCKAYIIDSGDVSLETHKLKFKTATARKIILEATPLNGGESFKVSCKLKRGKVVTASLTVPAGTLYANNQAAKK